MTAASRAQSHTLGVLLLTGVVVILVGGGGLLYVSQLGSNDSPLVDSAVEVTTADVIITHHGGDSLSQRGN